MFSPFLSTKSRKTSKSKISNKYLKPFPRNNILKSVPLAVALSVDDHRPPVYIIYLISALKVIEKH